MISPPQTLFKKKRERKTSLVVSVRCVSNRRGGAKSGRKVEKGLQRESKGKCVTSIKVRNTKSNDTVKIERIKMTDVDTGGNTV